MGSIPEGGRQVHPSERDCLERQFCKRQKVKATNGSLLLPFYFVPLPCEVDC